MIKWIFLLALTLVACGPPVRGVIDPSGFAHKDYDLKVAPQSPESLMGPGWLLDNYYRDQASGLKPKTGDDYELTYELDYQGDGTVDTKEDEFVYDLRFKHARHDGTVFLRTIPLSNDQAQKKLRVLLNRYAEAVAGAGYELVVLGDSTIVREKRYAVVVSEESETQLAGRNALFARLEVANLDQIKLDPDARKEQVALVLAHTTFKYKSAVKTTEVHQFPVLLVVGYANQPEDFEEGLEDFYGFLKRISIDGKTGYTPPKVQPSEPEKAPEQSGVEQNPPKVSGSKESDSTQDASAVGFGAGAEHKSEDVKVRNPAEQDNVSAP